MTTPVFESEVGQKSPPSPPPEEGKLAETAEYVDQSVNQKRGEGSEIREKSPAAENEKIGEICKDVDQPPGNQESEEDVPSREVPRMSWEELAKIPSFDEKLGEKSPPSPAPEKVKLAEIAEYVDQSGNEKREEGSETGEKSSVPEEEKNGEISKDVDQPGAKQKGEEVIERDLPPPYNFWRPPMPWEELEKLQDHLGKIG